MYESIKLKIIKSPKRLEFKPKWDKKMMIFIVLMALEIVIFEILNIWGKIDVFILFIFIAIFISIGYQDSIVIDSEKKSITIKRGVWSIAFEKSLKSINPTIDISQSKPLFTGVQIPMDINRYTLSIMVDDAQIKLASSSSKSEIERLKDTVSEYLPKN